MAQLNLKDQLTKFIFGDYDATDVETQCQAGWYDWFCRDESLPAKTKKLYGNILQIRSSKKINIEKMYVIFKNNAPLSGGSTYDDFRIYDLTTNNPLYVVVPKSTIKMYQSKGLVYGRENNFQEPLVVGNWKAIKNYFNK